MRKKLSSKLLALITVIAVLASVIIPQTGVFVQAADPTVPEKAIAVLDAEGIRRRLGDNAGWQMSWVTDWHSKDGAGDADFSDATSIEFDIEIGDYNALKQYIEGKNLSMWFRVSSGTNRFMNSTAALFTFDDLVPLYDNWYHVVIPMSKFTRNENGTTDWSSIKNWSFFCVSTQPLGDLYSMDFNIINICAVSTRPGMPDNVVVVIDEKGRNNTLGNSATSGQFTWLQDRVNGLLSSPVDVTKADFIEFDVQINKYDELIASMKKNNVVLGLSFSSNPSTFYEQRDAVLDILRYATPIENDWYHFAIPVDDFTAYNQADWSNIYRWMFFFEGSGRPNTLGSIYDCSFYAINICGTEYVPDVQDNAVVIIDKNGNKASFGADFSVELSDTVDAKDASGASRIDFDFRSDNFDAVKAAMQANSLSLELTLVSSNGKKATAKGIEEYSAASYNGWYHASVMKTVFEKEDGFDWADITGWSLGFTGNTSASSAELNGTKIELINLVGAVAPRPELPNFAGLPLDEQGTKGTLAPAADTKWSELLSYHKNTGLTAVDYTSAYYIEFDIEIGDIVALKKLIKDNEVTPYIVIASDDSFESYAESEFSFDELTHIDDSWYHAAVKVEGFTDKGINLAAVTSWCLSFRTANGDKEIGEDYSMKFNIGNVCCTERPKLPENAAVVIDESGSVKTFMNAPSWLWRFLNDYHNHSGLTPSDITNIDYIEFDLEIGDYTKLINAMNDKGMSFTFRLTSSNNLWQNSIQCGGVFNYMEHTFGNWYHVRIPIDNFANAGHGDIDLTAINTWLCFSGGSLSEEVGDIYSIKFSIVNVCGTVYETEPLNKPALPSDAVYVMDQQGKKGTLGKGLYSKYSDISDTFTSTHFLRGEADLAKYIAFQLYVENKDYIPEDLSIAFKLENGEYIEAINIADQIVNSSWNEIVIPVTELKVSDEADIGKLAGWKLVSENENALGGSYDTELWVCNFIGIVVADAPNMPENTIAILNYRGITTTLGGAYSWLQDRLYQQGTETFDVSDGDYVELDLFVSDYDALMKAYEENPENITSFIFCISSGDPSKYGNPRYFNRVQYNILPLITKSGWNHIKIPLHKMTETGEGPIDLENVRNFMTAISGTDNQLSTGDNANLTFKLINVCVTRVRPLINIETDDIQAFRPDENAVYINDAEDIFDDNGTWNPVAVDVDYDYKTEGSASVYNTLFDQTLRSNQLRYLFNETADVSDMQTVKFDLFIRDVDLLRQRATMSMVLSSDARGINNFNSWKLDLSKLKDGWNSIEIDISKGYTSKGRLDLSALKAFIVQCDTASFKSDEYVEKVVIGLDNIRYISKTGNTELKINSKDDEDFEEDFEDTEIDFDIEEEPEIEQNIITKPGKADTQIIKKNITQTIMQYSWLIIALAAEAVVIAAVLAVLLLIKKKKNKAQQ